MMRTPDTLQRLCPQTGDLKKTGSFCYAVPIVALLQNRNLHSRQPDELYSSKGWLS
ncbi:MAG: hypothetical protein WC756_14200 [Taibaiella sp.]